MKLVFISIIITLISTAGSSQNKAYISTKEAVEDINYMIKKIEEIHYNPYFKIEKKQFNENKHKLLNTFDKDSILFKNFMSTGMKLAAQMSGGHTAMDWQNKRLFPELMLYEFIPFTGTLSKDNSYLIVSRSATQDIKKGTFITSINGINVVDLYKECMSYIGGIESFKNVTCEKFFPLYLFFTDMISAPYSVELFNAEKELKITGLGVSELNTFISEEQQKENYTFEIIKDDIGLISYNSCTDYEGFKKFLENTFCKIKKKNIDKLIIDIRENAGGDSRLNDLLLSYITTIPYRQSSGRYWKVSTQAKLAYKNKGNYDEIFGKEFMKIYDETEESSIIESFDNELIHPVKPKDFFTGKTCFLIGASTFSSANFLADAIKTYKLSTLIGAATGELTNDFGELIDFTLPNSGNYIYVSSTYDIGANGNPNIYEPVYPDIKTKGNALLYALDWISN